MSGRALAIAGLAALALAAPRVWAGTEITPFVGSTFWGGATDAFGDSSHLAYGATLTLNGRDDLLGFEVDAQYVPHFFGGASRSNETSLMGELLVRLGDADGVRFFLAGGGGLLRSRVAGQDEFFDTDRNSFGVVVGGSMIAPLGDRLGLKLDLRYFRGLTSLTGDRLRDIDLTGFHFWRASVGLALRL